MDRQPCCEIKEAMAAIYDNFHVQDIFEFYQFIRKMPMQSRGSAWQGRFYGLINEVTTMSRVKTIMITTMIQVMML